MVIFYSIIFSGSRVLRENEDEFTFWMLETLKVYLQEFSEKMNGSSTSIFSLLVRNRYEYFQSEGGDIQ